MLNINTAKNINVDNIKSSPAHAGGASASTHSLFEWSGMLAESDKVGDLIRLVLIYRNVMCCVTCL